MPRLVAIRVRSTPNIPNIVKTTIVQMIYFEKSRICLVTLFQFLFFLCLLIKYVATLFNITNKIKTIILDPKLLKC